MNKNDIQNLIEFFTEISTDIHHVDLSMGIIDKFPYKKDYFDLNNIWNIGRIKISDIVWRSVENSFGNSIRRRTINEVNKR